MNGEFITELERIVSGKEIIYLGENSAPIILRNGEPISLEKYAEFPSRKKGQLNLHSLDSFIQYVVKHQTENSIIISDHTNNEFYAIFNYHSEAQANWCDFTCSYTLKQSSALLEFIMVKNFDQEQFADFIDDHMGSIISPDATMLYDLVLDLENTKTIKFKSRVNRESNVRELQCVSDDGIPCNSESSLPLKLSVSIPIFKNSSRSELEFNLCPKIKDNVITFSLKAPSLTERTNDLLLFFEEEIRSKTGLDVLLGSC